MLGREAGGTLRCIWDGELQSKRGKSGRIFKLTLTPWLAEVHGAPEPCAKAADL